ncbi:hypothetical protein OESDEN_12362, partial [Oesophagostomum dentatum]
LQITQEEAAAAGRGFANKDGLLGTGLKFEGEKNNELSRANYMNGYVPGIKSLRYCLLAALQDGLPDAKPRRFFKIII